MKKLLTFAILTVVLCIIVEAKYSQAFNSGTHIYIAERVFPYCLDKIDLYYGSIAPDLDMFVTQPEEWPTAFEDTHKNIIDLRSDAWTLSQKAFAKGWYIHNGVRGADFYAHGKFPQSKKGYVIIKANLLMPGAEGLELDFAHSIIETAIDLLVKYDLDHKIGKKLLKTCEHRSLSDLYLLVKVFVYQDGVTDLGTLVSAESFFRGITIEYAKALSLPRDRDQKALAQLIAQIAQEMYGMEWVTPEVVYPLLVSAVSLCEEDYQVVIDSAIERIRKYSKN